MNNLIAEILKHDDKTVKSICIKIKDLMDKNDFASESSWDFLDSEKSSEQLKVLLKAEAYKLGPQLAIPQNNNVDFREFLVSLSSATPNLNSIQRLNSLKPAEAETASEKNCETAENNVAEHTEPDNASESGPNGDIIESGEQDGEGIGTLNKKLIPLNTVFVNKIAYTCDDETLRKEFEPCGEIISCRIIRDREKRSKGYGFINFRTTDGLKKALKLDEKAILDMNVRITPSERTGTKVFVGHLNQNVKYSDFLKFLLSKSDLIVSVCIKAGYAFVIFENMGAANQAVNRLNRADFEGKALNAEISRNSAIEDEDRMIVTPSKTLYLRNIADSVKESDLREIFKKYGKIEDCYVSNPTETQTKRNYNTSFAFITFESLENATRAHNIEMDRLIEGQVLRIEFSMDKEKRQEEKRKRRIRDQNGRGRDDDRYRDERRNEHRDYRRPERRERSYDDRRDSSRRRDDYRDQYRDDFRRERETYGRRAPEEPPMEHRRPREGQFPSGRGRYDYPPQRSGYPMDYPSADRRAYGNYRPNDYNQNNIDRREPERGNGPYERYRGGGYAPLPARRSGFDVTPGDPSQPSAPPSASHSSAPHSSAPHSSAPHSSGAHSSRYVAAHSAPHGAAPNLPRGGGQNAAPPYEQQRYGYSKGPPSFPGGEQRRYERGSQYPSEGRNGYSGAPKRARYFDEGSSGRSQPLDLTAQAMPSRGREYSAPAGGNVYKSESDKVPYYVDVYKKEGSYEQSR